MVPAAMFYYEAGVIAEVDDPTGFSNLGPQTTDRKRKKRSKHTENRDDGTHISYIIDRQIHLYVDNRQAYLHMQRHSSLPTRQKW